MACDDAARLCLLLAALALAFAVLLLGVAWRDRVRAGRVLARALLTNRRATRAAARITLAARHLRQQQGTDTSR